VEFFFQLVISGLVIGSIYALVGLGFVEDRYKEVIAALYGEKGEVEIDTTIKFQDGKIARIHTRLLVRRLELGKAA
jgi:hypothetical protein